MCLLQWRNLFQNRVSSLLGSGLNLGEVIHMYDGFQDDGCFGFWILKSLDRKWIFGGFRRPGIFLLDIHLPGIGL